MVHEAGHKTIEELMHPGWKFKYVMEEGGISDKDIKLIFRDKLIEVMDMFVDNVDRFMHHYHRAWKYFKNRLDT